MFIVIMGGQLCTPSALFELCAWFRRTLGLLLYLYYGRGGSLSKVSANQRLRFRYGVAVLLGDTHMLQVHLVLSFHAHVAIGDRVRGP